MSSVFALNVTPKKQIFLFLTLLLSIWLIFFKSNSDLKEFDLITLLITDKFVLNLSAVAAIALVSFGKQDPPYAGPALKKRLPILLSKPIPIEISSTSMFVFSHKFAISLINVILVARKAFDEYLISSAALLDVFIYFAPFDISGK